jgi:hypothetical protein
MRHHIDRLTGAMEVTMRRAVLLVAVGLTLIGCTAYRTAYRELSTRLNALQNPRYPGDANRDLVPYQARNRDAAACEWSNGPEDADTKAKLDALPATSVQALLENPAFWEAVMAPFYTCMAAKGWR